MLTTQQTNTPKPTQMGRLTFSRNLLKGLAPSDEEATPFITLTQNRRENQNNIKNRSTARKQSRDHLDDAPIRTSFESVLAKNTNDTSSQKHRRYLIQEDQSSCMSSDESESCCGIPSNSSNSIESSSSRLRPSSSLRRSQEIEPKFKQTRRYSLDNESLESLQNSKSVNKESEEKESSIDSINNEGFQPQINWLVLSDQEDKKSEQSISSCSSIKSQSSKQSNSKKRLHCKIIGINLMQQENHKQAKLENNEVKISSETSIIGNNKRQQKQIEKRLPTVVDVPQIIRKFQSVPVESSNLLISSLESEIRQESTIADSEEILRQSPQRETIPILLDDDIIMQQLSKLSKKQLFEKTVNKAKSLAKIFNGIVKSETQFSICKGVFSIRFNCQNEHNFYLTIQQINRVDLQSLQLRFKRARNQVQDVADNQIHNQGLVKSVNLDIDGSCWCPRCVEYFEHCQTMHDSNRLQIMGGLFTKAVTYRCHCKGHVFNVSSLRKHKFQKQYRIQDQQCPDCRKDEKEAEKRAAIEEEERLNKIKEQHQKELFEQSQRECQENEWYYQQQWQHHEYQQAQQMQANEAQTSLHMQQQEKQINQKAQHLADQFLSSLENSDQSIHNSTELSSGTKSTESVNHLQKLNFDQVFLVYKFLETPIEFIAHGMKTKSQDDVKKYVRSLAKQLHPDKNSHPKSNEVFQKIQQAVELSNKLRQENLHSSSYNSYKPRHSQDTHPTYQSYGPNYQPYGQQHPNYQYNYKYQYKA